MCSSDLIHILPLGQGGPHHLKSQAGDAHGVSTGKGQYHLQGSGLSDGRLKQQGFLVQGNERRWPMGAPSPYRGTASRAALGLGV